MLTNKKKTDIIRLESNDVRFDFKSSLNKCIFMYYQKRQI